MCGRLHGFLSRHVAVGKTMKICLDNFPEELHFALNEMRSYLPLEIVTEGEYAFYQAVIAESPRLSKKNVFTIEYSDISSFVRLFCLSVNGFEEFCEESAESLGFMADCSRNAVLSVSSLKQLIVYLSMSGYNSLQLYTEDMLEVRGEPYFGYLRGRYTAQEIRDVAVYGEKMGVHLVPCIQTLAHLKPIFKWREYWSINDVGDILLADDERTYRLIDHVIAFCAENFICKTINIGMDEAYLLGLGRYREKYGLVNADEIMRRHLNRVSKICRKYGLQPLMWSDMFFRSGRKELNLSAMGKSGFEQGLIYWDYYNDRAKEYEKAFQEHFAFTSDVTYAGGALKWIGFCPDNRYSLHVLKAGMKSARASGVKKFLLTAWGDDGAECSVFSVLPAIVYFGCAARGKTETNHRFKRIFKSVAGMEYDDFILIDAANRITASNDPMEMNGSNKALLYNDAFLGIFDPMIFENGEMYRNHIRKIKPLLSHPRWGYLFVTQKALLQTLELKHDLGVKTRQAYAGNNHEEIVELINVYRLIEKRLLRFEKAFFLQWQKENKPYGYEVQEMRLGGLMLRLSHCRKRLKKYLDCGEKIPELEEVLLSIFAEGESTPLSRYMYCGFADFTVNYL